jgi:hypothetical protein
VSAAKAMHRLRLVAVAVLLFAPLAATPATAERDCPGGVCKCSGVPDCKHLETSGQCGGPIQCGDPREQCGCVAKAGKGLTNSINQKQPVSKSQ